MFVPSRSRRKTLWLIVLTLTVVCIRGATAQTIDVSDGESDPVKLFERGQNAHAKGDLERALAYYEEAIKLRPEFPEAEYQRGIALGALKRPAEAANAFRRAIELRRDWPLPYGALGCLLGSLNRDKEAEPLLRRAVHLGASDFTTLYWLSTVRWRAGDKQEALALAQRATEDENASASVWAWRGMLERTLGNSNSIASLEHALQIDPKNVVALKERAEVSISAKSYQQAIDDLKTSLSITGSNRDLSLRLAQVYELAGKKDEAQRIYQELGAVVDAPQSQTAGVVNVVGSAEDIAAANSDDPKIAQPALEKLIATNPKNATLFARLGEVSRLSDPRRSADSYRRASEIDPGNPKYATGYASALVQARRFAEAIPILRQVIASAPSEYVAHSNLALALFELKNFAQALPEYEWLASARPELPVTYFYMAIAHDNLGEYRDALNAYERFLSLANPIDNKLEIEKVDLRLPKLRDQIKRGQGVKKKQP